MVKAWVGFASGEISLPKKSFDPLEYIENAFLDRRPAGTLVQDDELSLPRLGDYLDHEGSSTNKRTLAPKQPRRKFRRTLLSAPRPRMKEVSSNVVVIDPQLREIWQSLPKSINFLCQEFDDAVTANYYRGDFKESRTELVRRLLDPEISLEEASRLLGVCPATVRRYTNRGWLAHHRTPGGQRRFRLSHVIKFVEEHGRFPVE